MPPDDGPGWPLYLDLILHPPPELLVLGAGVLLYVARCLGWTRWVPGLEELLGTADDQADDRPGRPGKPAGSR